MIKQNSVWWRVIVVVSIAIPALVAILLYTSLDTGLKGQWVSFLPTLNAVINSTTTVLLILALWAIFNHKINLHRNLMLTSLFLGVVFLLSYVLYHASSDSTVFGDVNHNGVLEPGEQAELGGMRLAYLIILLSHISLSIVVVPFVLLSFYFSLSGQLDKHRRIVKYSYPVWFYVSLSGVIVYLMISPYYL